MKQFLKIKSKMKLMNLNVYQVSDKQNGKQLLKWFLNLMIWLVIPSKIKPRKSHAHIQKKLTFSVFILLTLIVLVCTFIPRLSCLFYRIRQINNYVDVMKNQDFELWRKEMHEDQSSLVKSNGAKFELEVKFLTQEIFCLLKNVYFLVLSTGNIWRWGKSQ